MNVLFTSRALVLPAENIDTDQIIPARFLTTTDKTGLGGHLFADWRYDESGAPKPSFVLNQPGAADAHILVAGANFGCGSSREHAPWALMGFGLRAIVSTRFADIFRNNALKNGLLPITVSPAAHEHLMTLLAATPRAELTVDLADQTLTMPDGRRETFPIDAFAKHCLLNGVDQLGFLLKETPAIEHYEATHSGRVTTTLTLA